MVNYNTLKPGTYIQDRHGYVKAITTAMLSNGDFRFDGSNPSASELARRVSWVYIALSHRRAGLDQVAAVVNWQRRNVDLETDELGFAVYDELPRIDEALQVYGKAVYYKNPTRGREIVLDWLEPWSVSGDPESVDNGKYTGYIRKTRNKHQVIDADQLLIIQRKGMSRLLPATAAGEATRLTGQILLSMETTLDDLYDSNFMPTQLIHVPQGTTPSEKERVESRFKRLWARRSTRTNKTIAVERGIGGDTISITPISLQPDNLELDSTRDNSIKAILLAHDVPISVLESVNKAEAGVKSIDFIRNLVGRTELIARAVNQDPDIAALGLSLAVKPTRLEAYQAARLQQAEAYQRLVGGPIMAANEARVELDMEPLPGHDDIITVSSPFGQLPRPAATVPDTDTKSSLWLEDSLRLDQFIDKGLHKKRRFQSNELTDDQIQRRIEVHEMEMVKAFYP